MTTEDLIQLHIDRLALLDGFLRAAHLGRRGAEPGLARKIRRRLIGEIEGMVAYEQAELRRERDYLEATTAAERAADEGVDGWDDDFSDEFDVMDLLDAVPILGEGRAFDTAVGRWYRVEKAIPSAGRSRPRNSASWDADHRHVVRSRHLVHARARLLDRGRAGDLTVGW